MANNTQFHFTIDRELLQEARKRADNDTRTFSSYVRALITKDLKDRGVGND